MKVNLKEEKNLKYRCRVCGYVYDPEKGDEINLISPGVEFIDLPDTWRCPVCNYSKKEYRHFAAGEESHFFSTFKR